MLGKTALLSGLLMAPRLGDRPKCRTTEEGLHELHLALCVSPLGGRPLGAVDLPGVALGRGSTGKYNGITGEPAG
jgi:hypothetical protein